MALTKLNWHKLFAVLHVLADPKLPTSRRIAARTCFSNVAQILTFSTFDSCLETAVANRQPSMFAKASSPELKPGVTMLGSRFPATFSFRCEKTTRSRRGSLRTAITAYSEVEIWGNIFTFTAESFHVRCSHEASRSTQLTKSDLNCESCSQTPRRSMIGSGCLSGSGTRIL
jgi:hypothetical protein